MPVAGDCDWAENRFGLYFSSNLGYSCDQDGRSSICYLRHRVIGQKALANPLVTHMNMKLPYSTLYMGAAKTRKFSGNLESPQNRITTTLSCDAVAATRLL